METGIKSFDLEVDNGMTAGKAILKIVALYPVLRKFWVTEDGDLSEHVLVVLNGVEIHAHPEGLRTIVHSGDRLDFFSPLAGG